MANYQAKLVPSLLNFSTESGLDTSIVNGVSKQRTINCLEVGSSGDFKSVSVSDGETFSDTVQTITSITGVISA